MICLYAMGSLVVQEKSQGPFPPSTKGNQKKKKEKSGDKEVVVAAAADVNYLDVYISAQFFL